MTNGLWSPPPAPMNTMVWLGTLLLLVGAHGCRPGPGVNLELFVVGLNESPGGASYLHRMIEWDLENPDDSIRRMMEKSGLEVVMFHSTSWRFEKNKKLVLTYLAWARDGTMPENAKPLPEAKTDFVTDPLKPRPESIAQLDPLFHGLRHFAFLLKNDAEGTVRAALGDRAVDFLKTFSPAAAGSL